MSKQVKASKDNAQPRHYETTKLHPGALGRLKGDRTENRGRGCWPHLIMLDKKCLWLLTTANSAHPLFTHARWFTTYGCVHYQFNNSLAAGGGMQQQADHSSEVSKSSDFEIKMGTLLTTVLAQSWTGGMCPQHLCIPSHTWVSPYSGRYIWQMFVFEGKNTSKNLLPIVST